jgi:POT family proton-dependent oligopeptide transporter
VAGGGAPPPAGGARVSPLWLVLSYWLQTMGELCLSPVGLSAMSKLAPVRIAGLIMGVWYLSLSVGNYLAGMASSFYETMPLSTLFAVTSGTALIAAVALALLVRPMRRMLER